MSSFKMGSLKKYSRDIKSFSMGYTLKIIWRLKCRNFWRIFLFYPLPLYRHVCISYKLYLRIKESILTELNILPELNILTELNILSCLGDLLQGFKFGQV